MLSRSAENKSAKSEQFAVDFLDFGMSESCFFVILEALVVILDAPGGPGCPFWGFWGLLWFWGRFGDEKLVPFGVQNATSNTLWAVFIFDVFCSAHFSCFLWFWVPGGSILVPCWLLFGSPGPLKKQLKVWSCQQFQRFYLVQTESFCRSWLWVRFDDEFLQFFMIFGVSRIPFWDLLAPIMVTKGGLKNRCKKLAKRGLRA